MHKFHWIRGAAAGTAAAVLLSMGILFLTGCSGDSGTKEPGVSGEVSTEQTVEIPPETTEEPRILIQGQRYALDTQSITVQALTQEEAELLDALTDLKQVDGTGCKDISVLAQLQRRRPECQVLYRVNAGGQELDSQIRELTLSNVSYDEAERALELLPRLEQADLRQAGLADEELKSLIRAYPDVFLLCTLDFLGVEAGTDAELIDISGHKTTREEAEELLQYFPKLTKLIMSNCGIDDDTMDAFNLSYPDISIAWSIRIGDYTYRTDAKYFYPAGLGEHNLPSNNELKKLRYFRDIIAMDLGHSRVSEIEWIVNMPHMRYLILADTRVADISPLAQLKELVYLELFKMVNLKDASPLLECTALQDLNISSTYCNPEPLTKMTWLHNLYWRRVDENPATRDWVEPLKENLSDTNVVIRPLWRTIGGSWRYVANYYVFRDIIGGDYFDQYTHSTTEAHWGEDSKRILDTQDSEEFAGDVLAEIVRRRIDNGEPIPGIKNIGSEKAELLYESLRNSRP